MNTITDLEQRQRALNPAESFIVQAPAGSGKTELLIQRYLSMLARVSNPEEIVAITFTRKAAAEMRGRVINALDRVINETPPVDSATEATHILAIDVITQDKKLDWHISENPGRLRIQTIDSLTASLTRQMPILARFGAQPETIENASEFYQLAAANTLAELESGDVWSDAIAVLLNHLDNDLPRVKNMLASMLARRDQWLRHVARKHQRQELETGLRNLVESELTQLEQCLTPPLQDELLVLLRYAATNLTELGSDSLICHCLDIDEIPGTSAEDLLMWQAITTLLFTQSDGWRKSATVKLGFPAASGNKAEAETRKAMKTRFSALIANLSNDDNLGKQLLEVKYLPPISYSDREWEVVDALYQLLVLADAQLRLLFAERNQMDFTGITEAAIQALGEYDVPSDLALQLDNKIGHILVDEFQDISVNQYNLLEKLTAGWSMDDGHSLFLVGDPMQSIYRFREAEVGLFLTTWDQRRLNQVALTPLNITVNFRSVAGIVDWVNNSFAQVLPAKSDVGRGAVKYVKAHAYHSSSKNTSVVVHPILSRNDLNEAKLVLQLIKEARQEDPANSLAILVRNRSHLTEIVTQFRLADVPYRAVEIEALGQRAAIQDLLALTLALTHFADRISWLAILRAPWCGLSLSDLDNLFGHDKRLSIWEAMRDTSRLHSLSDDSRLRLAGMIDVLEPALNEKCRRGLSRWVESVWMNIGGPASLQYESDLENSQTFFQLLNDFDEGGDLRDRAAFTEKVASLYAAADMSQEDAVQIMTIHKAKGLEFDTVILPGLSRGSGFDEAKMLLWLERPRATHQDLLLAPVKEVGKVESLIYNYLKRLEKEKQHFELGRLIYVATTRARKNLHIIATAEVSTKDNMYTLKSPRHNSLLMQLWPVVKSSLEDLLKNYVPDKQVGNSEVQTSPFLLRRLSSDWTIPIPRESAVDNSDEQTLPGMSVIEYEWAGETIKHIGTVVHRCIQWIADEKIEAGTIDGMPGLNSYQEILLKRLGVSEKDLGHAVSQVQLAIRNMLADERGRWLFSKSHIDARNEYALSGVYQGKVVNVILDRTFVDADGTRWVVDYKTSRHEGKDISIFLDQQKSRYQEQLEKYGTLISGMENRPVKLGLYFPLLQEWREWRLLSAETE